MNKTTTCGLVTAISGISTILQPNEQLQGIQFWLTIGLSILTALTFLFDLFIGMYKIFKKWHQEAMKDGKITRAEKKELKKLMQEEMKRKLQAFIKESEEVKENASPKEEIKPINQARNDKEGHGGTF